MTLEEFLNYDDGTDAFYELVNGELLKMPSESDLNQLIVFCLLAQLLRIFPARLLRNKTEIVISGSRATTRIPDLMVLTEELAEALTGSTRSIVLLDMPSPLLVVEVVSPGTEGANRDYRYKRSEYAARGILEYWIVDPIAAQVTVLTLVSGLYEDAVFKGNEIIVSSLLPTLTLTAAQVLQPNAQ
jgi:Uma2 family endonuclease